MERIIFTYTSRNGRHSLVGSCYPSNPFSNTRTYTTEDYLLRLPNYWTGVHGLLLELENDIRHLQDFGSVVIHIEGSKSYVEFEGSENFFMWRVYDGDGVVRGRGYEFNNRLTEAVLTVLREEQV